MKWILGILLAMLLAFPALAAEKPIKQDDLSRLTVIDLRIALAREQYEKFSFQFQAEVLRLQIQDGAVGCELSQAKRAWVCPKPAKAPEPKKD